MGKLLAFTALFLSLCLFGIYAIMTADPKWGGEQVLLGGTILVLSLIALISLVIGIVRGRSRH